MPRTDRATRVINAEPARVYAAFVERDALLSWLPPDGMTGRFERFDLREGGGYTLELTYADELATRGKTTGRSDLVHARVLGMVPGRELVQEVDFASDDAAYAGTMRMTWRVLPQGRQSLVEIVAEGVPDGISAEDHARGFASSLAQLAAYVERGA